MFRHLVQGTSLFLYAFFMEKERLLYCDGVDMTIGMFIGIATFSMLSWCCCRDVVVVAAANGDADAAAAGRQAGPRRVFSRAIAAILLLQAQSVRQPQILQLC